jgi:hypothetical protein
MTKDKREERRIPLQAVLSCSYPADFGTTNDIAIRNFGGRAATFQRWRCRFLASLQHTGGQQKIVE